MPSSSVRQGFVPWLHELRTHTEYLPFVIIRHIFKNPELCAKGIDFRTLALFVSRRSPNEIHAYTKDTESMSRFFSEFYDIERVLLVTGRRMKLYLDERGSGRI